MKTMLHLLLLCTFMTFSTAQAAEHAAPQTITPEQATPDNTLKPIALGIVKAVPKPNIVLLDDNRYYVLDNVRIPVEYSPMAQKYLTDTLIGKKVGIYTSALAPGAMDRNGNIFAHLVMEDGSWVQANMVSQGLAWAYSTPDHYEMVNALYVFEDKARNMRAGFWRDPKYAIKDMNNIQETIGSFQIYQGKLYSWKTATNMPIILRFSDPSKQDLILIIKDKGRLFHPPRYNMNGINALINRTIRVRGWVENNNGAVMDLSHPEQIEILPDPKKKK